MSYRRDALPRAGHPVRTRSAIGGIDHRYGHPVTVSFTCGRCGSEVGWNRASYVARDAHVRNVSLIRDSWITHHRVFCTHGRHVWVEHTLPGARLVRYVGTADRVPEPVIQLDDVLQLGCSRVVADQVLRILTTRVQDFVVDNDREALLALARQLLGPKHQP